jgi:hypothetical protein
VAQVRRKLTTAGLVCALAGMAWLAAPALSLAPYLPKAVDFERPLPAVHPVQAQGVRSAGSGSEEEPVRFLSAVAEAPKRFDAVGLAGETRDYEMRVRYPNGTWSEWVEVVDGNPLYSGGSDHVQLRSRSFRPEGTLHFVNVSGTDSAAHQLLSGARRAINSAFVRVASPLAPDDASADAPRPSMHGRGDWNGDQCPPREDPALGKVNSAVVHHTATANRYSSSEVPGIILSICRFHRNGNGWSDIGYNALVDRYGAIWIGRAGAAGTFSRDAIEQPIVGAHTGGYNSETTGVSKIGTHTSKRIGTAAMTALRRFIAWKLELHGIHDVYDRFTYQSGRVSRRITYHKKLTAGTQYATSCPGAAAIDQISELQARTQNRMNKY